MRLPILNSFRLPQAAQCAFEGELGFRLHKTIKFAQYQGAPQ
jgi:hypothetical protein